MLGVYINIVTEDTYGAPMHEYRRVSDAWGASSHDTFRCWLGFSNSYGLKD